MTKPSLKSPSFPLHPAAGHLRQLQHPDQPWAQDPPPPVDLARTDYRSPGRRPGPAEARAELARLLNGHVAIGHNVGVDWRLLHLRYPAIAPAALIDTLRLARRLKLDSKNSLSALTAHLGLTAQVEGVVLSSQPHRALWVTVATALPLPVLIARCWPSGATLGRTARRRRYQPYGQACPVRRKERSGRIVRPGLTPRVKSVPPRSTQQSVADMDPSRAWTGIPLQVVEGQASGLGRGLR
jgi:DNA polymerase III epsilon subunit-like protein